MKFHKYSALLLTALSLPAAGELRLSGKVTDENSNPVEGAIVKLRARDSLETRTDDSGYFELTEKSVAAVIQDAENAMHRNNSTISGTRFDRDYREIVSIHDFKGRLLLKRATEEGWSASIRFPGLRTVFSPGVYLISVRGEKGPVTMFRYVHRGNDSRPINMTGARSVAMNRTGQSRSAQIIDFSDILEVSADGMQTVRRAVVNSQEENIHIKLMPQGVNYATPGIPVFSDGGGCGDVTTYGSVSDPEFSQGGACNYGSTGIRYYAAINVNQIPGDAQGQWNDGRCCGRCARVQVRNSDGEVRTTVVRIVDKCPDDNCGIDLGGAPAGKIMGNQPGRYSGSWEWVNCEEYDGVSDGPATIYTKEGTNEWWSLIQVRNGSGAVSNIRIRKIDGGSWIPLKWATEAENFFTVPEQMLQDEEQWKIEVLWDTGTRGSLLLPGNRLAVEDTSYQLIINL